MRITSLVLFMCLLFGVPDFGSQRWTFSIRPTDEGRTSTRQWTLLAPLDDCPEALTLALGEGFYVSYDVRNCSLNRAWNGCLRLEKDAAGEWGPKATHQGETVSMGRRENGWIVLISETAEDPNPPSVQVVFSEVRHEAGTTTVVYRGIVPGRAGFTIEETPELITDTTEMLRLWPELFPGGVVSDYHEQIGCFIRNFEFNDLPQEVEVVLPYRREVATITSWEGVDAMRDPSAEGGLDRDTWEDVILTKQKGKTEIRILQLVER